MANVITCPHCRRDLNLPEDLLGQPVQCPMCEETFSPAEANGRRPAPPPPGDDDWPDEVEDRPSRPTRRRRPARRRYDDYDDDRRPRQAHRGGIILAMGILSVVLSFVFILGLKVGIITLFMAHNDLIAMRNGYMDPAGEGLTRAGQVCALIGVGVSVLLGLLLFLVIVVARAH